MPAIDAQLGFVPSSNLENTNLMAELEAFKEDVNAQLSTLNTDVSGSSAYTPAVDADWNNDPPATFADALDRIAAALGPIT